MFPFDWKLVEQPDSGERIFCPNIRIMISGEPEKVPT